MVRGKFIVIEGGDGAGKDTQIDLLKEKLTEEHVLFVKDPGSTDIGWQLRDIVLRDTRVSRTAELLVYLASRAQLVDEKIRPALEKGVHVISNRFDLSTICYQIYGRERLNMLSFIKEMSAFACGGLVPDFLVYLDCPPEVGLRRVLEKKGEVPDRFEQEKLSFHERVREGYQKHIADYSHVVIDAMRPKEEVAHEVYEAIMRTVGRV